MACLKERGHPARDRHVAVAPTAKAPAEGSFYAQEVTAVRQVCTWRGALDERTSDQSGESCPADHLRLQLASTPGVPTEAPPGSIRFDDELADDAAPQQASPPTDFASSLEVHEHRETEFP